MNEHRKKKAIVLVANTSWFVWNFHGSLVKKLILQGCSVTVVAPFDTTSVRFAEIGAEYVEIQISRGSLLSFSDASFFFKLYRLFRTLKPDVVLHMTIKPVLYSTLAATAASVPAVVNMITGLGYVFIGNTFTHRIIRPIVKTLYRIVNSISKTTLFLNQDDYHYFQEHGLVSEGKSIVTNGSGVDLEYFSYSEPSARVNNCIVLFVGRILKDKGVNEFVGSAQILKTSFPSIRFQILGMIDLDNPTFISEEVINGWVSEKHIEYLGNVSDVRPVVQNADIVVLPSYREGIPRSLLEAMAMGRAIVATDVPGCKDVVKNHYNGLLVEPKNANALAEAIHKLVISPEQRKIMGINGRKLVAEKYDSEIIDEVIMNVLKNENVSLQ